MPKFDGVGLGLTIAGGILLWSGVQNVTVKGVLESLAKGAVPSKGPAETFASAPASASSSATAPTGDTSASSASAATNQAIARVLAAPYGWSTGQEWADLVSLWNRESGWSNTVANASSGALGIAQALGHGAAGTAGSLGNEYPSQAANNGDASAQISWGLDYIKDTY